IQSAKVAQAIEIEGEAEVVGEIRRGPGKILNSVLRGVCVEEAGGFRGPPSPWNCKDGASCREEEWRTIAGIGDATRVLACKRAKEGARMPVWARCGPRPLGPYDGDVRRAECTSDPRPSCRRPST